MQSQSHPATSLLDHLFSNSHLQLLLDDQRGNRKEVAFYDETLRPKLELSLPVSSALPSPLPSATSISASITFPFPIETSIHSNSEYEDEDDPSASASPKIKIPRILSVLLSNLQLLLEASYISNQPIPSPYPLNKPSSSGNKIQFPIPTASVSETGYQFQPSSSGVFQNSNPPSNLNPLGMQVYQNSFPVTFGAFSWAGNKEPHGKEKEKGRELLEFSEQSHVSWVADKSGNGKGRWKVVWECSVPIVYLRSRHTSPLIILTASLSLRLSSHLLSILLPTSNPTSELSTPFSNHDLLTNLSSGPIYPDESPIDKSRVNKNSTNLSHLPLDKIGKEYLGTNLITLENGRRNLMELTRNKKEIPFPHEDGDGEGDGDLAAFGSQSMGKEIKIGNRGKKDGNGIEEFDLAESSGSGKLSLTKDRLDSLNRDQETSLKEGTIGSNVKVLKRSCRRTLDVRSAIAVRMRTLLAPPLTKFQKRSLRSALSRDQNSQDLNQIQDTQMEEHSEEDRSDEELDEETELELIATRDSSLERALVLCVELENPSDSGVDFQVQGCSVRIEALENQKTSSEKSGSQPRLKATLLEDENSRFPMILKQGQQVNALYYVELNLGDDGIESFEKNLMGSEDGKGGQRHATIVVDGRPLLLEEAGDTEARGYDVEASGKKDLDPQETSSKSVSSEGSDFSSTWNCHIDTTVLQNALNRRKAASSRTFSNHNQAFSNLQGLPNNTNSSAPIIAGDHQHSASALAQLTAEESARSRTLSSPQVGTPQSRKTSASPIPAKSPTGPPPLINSLQGSSAILTQRRDTLTVDSSLGMTPNRSRMASLNGGPFSPTSSTPRNSSFGLGAPPVLREEATSNMASGVPSSARTPSGGVGLGLLAQARNRATSAQENFKANSGHIDGSQLNPTSNSSSTPIPTAVAQQRPLLERLTSLNSPNSNAPLTPGPTSSLSPSWPRSNHGSGWRKDVLPWTASSGPSAASLSRGVDHQAPLLISTKVEVKNKIGFESSIPTVEVTESFSLVVLIFNREVESRNFIISWPRVELDEQGEVGKETQPALVKGPRNSLVPNPLWSKNRLLDDESTRTAHSNLQATRARSALLPEENYFMIGPILPGFSESIHLPIRALTPGIHQVASAGLIISDLETGEERRLLDCGNIVVV